MDEKLQFGVAISMILSALLIASWCLGKDGVVTTAILTLIGTVIGSILGFHFGNTP